MDVVATARATVQDWGLAPEFERTLLDIVDRRSGEIRSLRGRTDARTETSVSRRRRRFPTTGGSAPETPRPFDAYDGLVPSLLICWWVEENLDDLLVEVRADCRTLGAALHEDRGLDDELVDFLVGGRWPRRDELTDEATRELLAWSDQVERELGEYEDEPAAYAAREIDSDGLSTRDAIKCLEDFEGRTLPFLRGICSTVEAGDAVLELGCGTGLFAFAAAVAGADRVTGVELNPVTCLLARRIRGRLAEGGVIERGTVDLLWGDGLRFRDGEYPGFGPETYELLLSENIYTGGFFEKQRQLVSHALDAKLVPTTTDGLRPYESARASGPVLPESMVTCAELVETNGPDVEGPMLVRGARNHAVEVTRPLTDEHPYVEFDFRAEAPAAVRASVAFETARDGRVDAVALFSAVKVAPGEYIGRGEDRFLGNDILLLLDEPMTVTAGQRLECGFAYDAGDDVADLILELQRESGTGPSVETESVRTLAVGAERHEENRRKFATRHGLAAEAGTRTLRGREQIRSERLRDGIEYVTFASLDPPSTGLSPEE